jgi:hypothetical protein
VIPIENQHLKKKITKSPDVVTFGIKHILAFLTDKKGHHGLWTQEAFSIRVVVFSQKRV